jgi:tetratricopeptide (TPR) repeat protein
MFRLFLLSKYTALIFCFFISFELSAQNFDGLVAEAAKFELIPNEKMALLKYGEAYKIQPTNLNVIYKCAELNCRIGSRESNTDKRDKYYHNGLAFSKLALKLYPNSNAANLSMSIALGKIALSKSGSEKVNTVKEIKYYAERAIHFNPNDYKAWHVIGKWNYEISNLNFIEKTALRLFFGGLPEASFQRSINAYEKAKSINPNFCLNYLELAKAYEKNGDKKKAKSIIIQLLKIPNSTEDDPIVKKEANDLIKNW